MKFFGTMSAMHDKISRPQWSKGISRQPIRPMKSHPFSCSRMALFLCVPVGFLLTGGENCDIIWI